jgi:hypothetical protein
MIVVFNFLTLIYYDPKFLTEKGGADGPPNWVYFTWGIGLFLYQSFDAVDGCVLASFKLTHCNVIFCSENRPAEQAWLARWVNCLIMVCLEPLLPLSQLTLYRL